MKEDRITTNVLLGVFLSVMFVIIVACGGVSEMVYDSTADIPETQTTHTVIGLCDFDYYEGLYDLAKEAKIPEFNPYVECGYGYYEVPEWNLALMTTLYVDFRTNTGYEEVTSIIKL